MILREKDQLNTSSIVLGRIQFEALTNMELRSFLQIDKSMETSVYI